MHIEVWLDLLIMLITGKICQIRKTKIERHKTVNYIPFILFLVVLLNKKMEGCVASTDSDIDRTVTCTMTYESVRNRGCMYLLRVGCFALCSMTWCLE